MIDRQAFSICGTKEYIAPEVYAGNGYSFSCDWWSYGCIVYEMLEGLPPFFCQDTDELFESIMRKEPEYNSHLSPVAKDFIRKLLSKNPKKRMTNPAEIKNHPFFKGIDWNKMECQSLKPPYIPNLKDESDLAHFD